MKKNKSLILFVFVFFVINILLIENFYSPLTLPLIVLVYIISSLNPSLTILQLVISQVFASPPILPITLLQLFSLIWVTVNILKFKYFTKFYFDAFKYFIPFFLFTTLISIFKYDLQSVIASLTLCLFLFIAYISWERVKDKNYIKYNIILGSFSGAIPFILKPFNLTYFSDERQHLIAGAMRGGVERFSAGLGDFNYIGACILVAFIGALSVYLFNKELKFKKRLFFLIISLASIPSIIATLSRTSILGIIISVLLILILTLHRRLIDIKKLINILFSLTIITIIFTFTQSELIENYRTAFVEFVNESNIKDARGMIFSSHIDNIINNPFFGDKVYINGVEFAAHNVFIQVASDYGILTFILFVYMVLWIPYKRYVEYSNLDNIAYFLMYLICIYSMMSLSIGGWKIFWLLWLILILLNQNRVSNNKQHLKIMC